MKRPVVFVIVALFAIAACSSPEPEEAVDDFCAAQDELTTSVGELSTLTLSSAADDVDTVRNEIGSAWETYETETEGLEESLKSQAQNAYTDYLNATEIIPPDNTIEQRVKAYVAAAEAFLADLRQISDSVNCE